MAEVLGDTSATTNQMLGELWSYGELTRAAVAAAEAESRDWGDGAWFCDDRPFWALRPTLPRWFPRAFEIVKLIGAHNLLATPTARELANPELRPLLDRYFRGAGEWSAEERTRTFRAAWDLVGSGLGGRGELYERFYLASVARTSQMAHAVARRLLDAEDPTLLDEFLGLA
jgi:4-hydroxyphenylacetate 3-monooxygenase